MDTSITAVLFGYGPLGVGIVVLALVVRYQNTKIESLYTKIEAVEKEKDALQEARRLDAVESRTEVTSLLPGISQSLQNISDKIEISKNSRRR